MEHHFNVEIAKEYGINQAIILNNLYYWISKNRANNKHFYDGNYWTYNSKKAFSELFPYLTERQIDYSLKKLIDDGLVIKGNYNKIAYDRTLWYAITKKGYSILQNCKMEDTNMLNGIYENVEPIPYNKPNNKKTNSKHNSPDKAEQDNIPYKDIILYLNYKINANYKYTTRKTRDLIKARFNEGFTTEDFKIVIDKKSREWLKDKKMSKFLRPETLFGTKFENYLNQKEERPSIRDLDIDISDLLEM